MGDNNKKSMTIDDLAVMLGKDFNDVAGRMATKQDLTELKQELKQEISEVKHEAVALKSNVNNYLELSEKRYA